MLVMVLLLPLIVLFVSVWLSVVPTISPVGNALETASAPAVSVSPVLAVISSTAPDPAVVLPSRRSVAIVNVWVSFHCVLPICALPASVPVATVVWVSETAIIRRYG
jgi:hypothetical protein